METLNAPTNQIMILHSEKLHKFWQIIESFIFTPELIRINSGLYTVYGPIDHGSKNRARENVIANFPWYGYVPGL